MLDNLVQTKYNTILVVNALNGAFALKLRERYPQARIVCAEYFPYFQNHLRKIGFEVQDWNKIVESSMKFDCIVGNPPYQDGNLTGGQNKIYNQFSRQALSLLNDSGVLAFITPTSVLKKSKRFSLVGVPGLRLVDFRANDHFSVGVKICLWIVDRAYRGDVTVVNHESTYTYPPGQVIYNPSEVDPEFAALYEALRQATSRVEDRMFCHNAIDMSTCRSSVQTTVFKYPIYKLNSDGTHTVCQYNSVQPKLYNTRSFTVSITKRFDESMTRVDSHDYDMTHVSVQVDNDSQVDNIKSFIFSDYFRQHVEQWKRADGYGWNYALLYLPPFDKNRPWTNQEVQEFIESFLP